MGLWEKLGTGYAGGESTRMVLAREFLGLPEPDRAPIVDHAQQQRIDLGTQMLDAQDRASRSTLDYVLGGK